MPPTLTGELKTITESAGFAPINDRAFLRITGPDATRWLNGMVTNNIQTLEPGRGNYNFFLNAQGRIQGDCTVYRDPQSPEPVYLLETDTTQLATIHQLLDKFIIMDDVELTGIEDRPQCLLLGETARLILGDTESGTYIGDEPPVPGPLTLIYPAHRPFQQITTPSPTLVPRFHLIASDGETSESLRQLFKESGAAQISPEALEALRILEARPRYGTDIRNSDTAKDLPQETNQTHALHFAKGCYLGQEIVERIRSRGQVHRLFTPFRLEGDLPSTLPAPLQANGKPAGELTSAITLSTTEGPVHLALGYARREFLEPHQATQTPLTHPGGTAHLRSAGSLT